MDMYGKCVVIKAKAGKRDALIERILDLVANVNLQQPQCHFFIVNKAWEDPDVIWTFEIFTSKEDNEVYQAAVGPLEDQGTWREDIMSLAEEIVARTEFTPVGGRGLTLRGISAPLANA